ncbi:MAG: CBS domain-containing protein [Flavobacteriaceae bacterium]|nr:CBS domain-containing protein [Flavobacteriaceae bacterium]
MKSIPVTSIMTTNVVCASPEQKIIDIKRIYEKEKFHHHIPVTNNDELVGMVSLIDFLYAIKGAGLDDTNTVYHELTVEDIMTPNPYSMTSNAKVEQVARELAKGLIHAIPIVESKKVVGIVSTADVIRFFLDKSKN